MVNKVFVMLVKLEVKVKIILCKMEIFVILNLVSKILFMGV